MQIRIEADLDVKNARQFFEAVAKAIVQKEAAELMDAFPAGEHFSMESQKGKVVITKL